MNLGDIIFDKDGYEFCNITLVPRKYDRKKVKRIEWPSGKNSHYVVFGYVESGKYRRWISYNKFEKKTLSHYQKMPN